jgi:hypothetical protein
MLIDNRLLIEWNRFLFEDLIPSIWSKSIPSLLKLDKSIDPWRLWPIPSKILPNTYWNLLPFRLFSKSFQARKAVWPLESIPTDKISAYTSITLSSDTLSILDDAFVVPEDMETTHIFAIVAAGIKLVRPPPHIFNFLIISEPPVEKLTSLALRERIQVSKGPFTR